MSDGEIAASWENHTKERQAKRKSNLEFSTQLLRDKGVSFESFNGGVHLVVKKTAGGHVDFWPSTGLFMDRAAGGKKERGVRKLLKLLGVSNVR